MKMRKPSKRTVGEHMATLTRVVQQLEVDDELPPRVKLELKRRLTEALKLLQGELVRRK